MIVHEQYKITKSYGDFGLLFLYCLFFLLAIALGGGLGAPAAKASPPERSEEIFSG